jgi:hypothetical protein
MKKWCASYEVPTSFLNVSLNQLLFKVERQYVSCEVGTGFLSIEKKFALQEINLNLMIDFTVM